MSDRKNSSWLAIQYLITVVFSLISIKINISNYGEELFGLWILFVSFWSIGNALDFGFGTAVVKFVAESKWSGEFSKIPKIVSSTFFILTLNGIIIFFIGNLISEKLFLTNKRIVSAETASMARTVFFILGINFYIQYLAIVFKALLEGLNDFVFASKINIIISVMNLLVVLGVNIFKQSMVTMSIGFAIVSLSTFIILYIYILASYKEIQLRIKDVNIKDLARLIKFSFFIQGSAILSTLIDPTIKYIIGNYSGLNFVSFYEVGKRFATAVSGLFFNTFRIILPKASILKRAEDYNLFLANEGSKYSFYGVLYSVAMFGVGSIFFVLLIHILFDSKEIIILFFLLCLPESVNNFGYIIYMFLTGIGQSKLILLFQAINLIVISGLLIAFFEFLDSVLGLFGYFLAVVFVNILMINFVKYLSGFSIKNFLQQVHIDKLLYLHILIFIGLLLMYSSEIHYLIIAIAISSISLLLIKNQIFVHSKFLLSLFNDYAKRKNK